MENKILNLLNESQRRKYSFTLFRQALSNQSLPTSNGWDGLQDKFIGEFEIYKDQPDEIEKIYHKLLEVFENFIDFNHKAVYIFQLSENQSNDLKQALDASLAKKNEIRDEVSSIYPMTLEEDRLIELSRVQADPIIVEKSNIRNLHTYHSTIFSSDILRVELDKEETAELINDEFYDSFESIVGYKHQYHQTIDKIIFDDESHKMYLYIDIGLLRTTTKSDQVAAKYLSLLNILLSPKNIPFTHTRLPLVDKIQELYNDYSYNSKVKELNHHTSTNSTKQEKMRNNKDLRDELYHKGGYESIDFKSELYYIKITYEANDTSKLDLTIPGSLRNNNWDNRAILENCQSQQEIDFLIEKLIYTIQPSK